MAIKTRQTTADGVTNNNAPLTNAELDNNFVEIVQGKADLSGADFTGNVTVDTDTLYVDATNDRVGINTNSPDTDLDISSSTGPTVRIQNTNTGLTSGSTVGKLEIYANDTSSNGTGAMGYLETTSTSSFGNNFKTVLGVPLGGGNNVLALANGSEHVFLAGNGSFTINENGSADSDFRVESDASTHMLFVDAGNNKVGINKSDPSYVLDISSSSNDMMQLTSTDGTGNSGPNLRLFRDSGTPADDDVQGTIFFVGKDDGGGVNTYAYIESRAKDVSDGAEKGFLRFMIDSNNSLANYMTLDGEDAEVCINEESRDIDFRVESDVQSHMLFVDAANSNVGIFESAPLTKLHVTSNSVSTFYRDIYATVLIEHDEARLQIISDDSGGDAAAIILTAGAKNWALTMGGPNNNSEFRMGYTVASADGNIGSSSLIPNMFSISTAGNVTFNERSADADFRVESDNDANAFFVDGANGNIGIGTNAPNSVPLHIKGASNREFLTIENTASAGTDEAGLRIKTPSAYFQFFAYGDESTLIIRDNNATTERMRFSSTELVVNEPSADFDFRVESDTQSHMLVVDAGAQAVRINSASDPDIVGTDRTFNFFANDTFALGNFSGSSSSYSGGAYIASSDGFGAEGSSTTITYSNSGAFSTDNTAGFIMVYAVSDANPGKAGTLLISFAKRSGFNMDVSTVSTHKASITTLTASASGNDILITHDSDVAISWIVLGAG